MRRKLGERSGNKKERRKTSEANYPATQLHSQIWSKEERKGI